MNNMGEYPRHVPAMSGLDLPVVPVSRSGPRLRVTAAVCAGLSAFLVILCSFLPLFSGELSANGQELGLTVTSWGFEVTEGDPFGAVPVSGYVLVAGAVLLLATALMCATAAMPTASRGAPRAAGLTAMAAAAFLTGTVWQIGMEVASFGESFQPFGVSEDEVAIETRTGVGLWLLVFAVVLALVAVVVALRSTREPSAHAALFHADLATPRHGFPMPVVGGAYPVQHPYPTPQQAPSPWAQQSPQRAAEPGSPHEAAQPSPQQAVQPGGEPSPQQAVQPGGEPSPQQAVQPGGEPSPQQAVQPSGPASVQPPAQPRPDQDPQQSTQPGQAEPAPPSQPTDRPTEPPA